MRYLIDTNIFLYLTTDVTLLSNDVRNILDDYENALYMSVESVKELILFYRKQKKQNQVLEKRNGNDFFHRVGLEYKNSVS